jgi:hypothetical protein
MVLQSDPINITNYTFDEDTTVIIENLSQLNTTRINFILTWEDDIISSGCIPYPVTYDTIYLTVTEPNRTTYNNQSKHERIEINVEANEIPSNQSLNASSEDEVITHFTQSKKIGNWTIRIKVEADGSTYAEMDQGNDWNLSIIVNYYIGIITT